VPHILVTQLQMFPDACMVDMHLNHFGRSHYGSSASFHNWMGRMDIEHVRSSVGAFAHQVPICFLLITL